VKTDSDRNLLIRQRAMEGVPRQAIAREFRLSRESIANVLQGFKDEEELARRRVNLREAIQQADDVDRKWPVADLIDAMALKGKIKGALLWFYGRPGTQEISLREIMDLVISEKKDPRPGYLITPLLNIREGGTKGFWSLVSALSDMDLGARGNAEWGRRLSLLRRSTRIRGDGPYSWSKPIDVPIPSQLVRGVESQMPLPSRKPQ